MADPIIKAQYLTDLLNDKGQDDYIGEPVSQLAHSLQAAHFAKQSHADDETVIAALLHDIGHFLPAAEVRAIAHEVRHMKLPGDDSTSNAGVGRVGHERIGQEFLRRFGFSEKVSALVGSHVDAKRYLCAVDPGYHDTLSEASKKSLIFQGGPMKGVELAQWSANPWRDEMCALRKWDDAAKVVGLEVDGPEAYREMITRLLSAMP